MLKKLRKLLGESTAPRSEVCFNGTEVPRYPPFAKGFPVVPNHLLLDTQQELVGRIYEVLGLPRSDFDTLVMPVLERYAGIVHLLPASESHHHRGMGGLLRHGLEVAHGAAQASRGRVFGMGSSPAERRTNEARWRMAAMLTGLLHDVGKPLSDVSVTDESGSCRWRPHIGLLTEWAAENRIERYFLKWTPQRHKRHESLSTLMMGRVLTPEMLDYLESGGSEIYLAVCEAVCGPGGSSPLAQLMLAADQASVARDLRENRISATDQNYGIPLERYVFDAMRSLIARGEWTVNTVGARVWHFKGLGVFVALRQGAQELYETARKSQVPGIPRDADTLADILLERGYAIPRPAGEQAQDRYWEISTVVSANGTDTPIKLLLLRLESPDLIFTTEPPPPIAGSVVGEVEASEESAVPQPTRESAQVPAQPQAQSVQSLESELTRELESKQASRRPMDFEALMAALEQGEPGQVEPESVPADPAAPAAEAEATPELKPDLPPPSPEGKAWTETPSVPVGELPGEVVEAAPGRAQDYESLLEMLDPSAQRILNETIGQVLRCEAALGERVIVSAGRLMIRYPKGFEGLGAEPSDCLAALADAGLIEADPIYPGRKVQTVDGEKVAVLADPLSSYALEAFQALEAKLDQDLPAPDQSMPDPSDAARPAGEPKRKSKARQPKAKILEVEPVPELPDDAAVSIQDILGDLENRSFEARLDEIEQRAAQAAEKGAEPDPRTPSLADSLQPQSITADEAIARLCEMIRAGAGEWIPYGVQDTGSEWVVELDALDRIAARYPHCFNKFQLRVVASYTPRLRIKQKKIWMTKD